MRAGHLWLLSFLVFPLVGAPLLKSRAFRLFGFPTRAVLSAGVGAVLLSWTMTLFALLRVRWGPLLVLVAAAIAVALRLLSSGNEVSVLSPRSWGEGPGGGRPSSGTLIAYSLTTLSLLAALLATVAGRSTSSDLILFWGAKAQQFALARTIDASFLSAPYMEYLHVYYPPLVTNVFAFPAMIAGRFPWGAAAQTFPLLLAATAIALAGILKTESTPPRAAATAALATCAIALLGIYASVAGNAEPFLMFFEILGLALLVTPIARSTEGKLLAGLLFAGAATSKVEGLVFVLAAGVLFTLIERDAARPAGRTLLLLFAPTIVALGTWFAFGEARHLFSGYHGYGSLLALRLGSLPTILSDVGVALWKAGYALPWLVPLVVLLLVSGKNRRALLPVATAVAIAGFLLFTYLTTEAIPRVLIAWSAARVLSPVSALFALASGVRDAR
ncbi:MAG TPA: hypothetical protein VGS98_09185 [Thermoanaerobaculia bacterium]|nr:hypothetical protein [Thermoanaerobaculia bacterium]